MGGTDGNVRLIESSTVQGRDEESGTFQPVSIRDNSLLLVASHGCSITHRLCWKLHREWRCKGCTQSLQARIPSGLWAVAKSINGIVDSIIDSWNKIGCRRKNSSAIHWRHSLAMTQAVEVAESRHLCPHHHFCLLYLIKSNNTLVLVNTGATRRTKLWQPFSRPA